ncbi:hypothetical protein FEFB_11000 [Fructobacillus sp. EFB-N1]|uniref:hypothetical protein n=1 Tax=Fructobacillus sp. EFB-N1 TaxID=1658766 RepID=UPI00064DF3F1|nr:hypothetical protein [Fructobacillus sp. EFB-N1]KMK53172.1 hypothetical protein FEFB_11000 [Fructobacillus sp. EFB-N1]
MKHKNKKLLRHTNEETEELLQNCFQNLLDYANSFDSGNFQSIRQAANIIRMLFYDSKTCHSLLNQITNKEDIRLLNTFLIDEKDTFYSGGVWIIQTFKKIPFSNVPDTSQLYSTFVPDDLEKLSEKREIVFKSWWNGIVFKLGNSILTRKDIIISMANQDGGSHVDTEVDETYLNIARGQTGIHIGTNLSDTIPLYFKSQNNDEDYEHPKDIHLAIMRKIVHEILYSLPKQLNLNINYVSDFTYNINHRIHSLLFNIQITDK